MTVECRTCWRNCGTEADAEILDIDRIEDKISPLSPNVSKIRELISTLELCHHKAERWVHNIIEAIGSGHTTKGLGTRSLGQSHPVEQVWQNACDALSAWCAGCPSTSLNLFVDTVPASQLLACVGERSPLKEWQVQRVTERIRSFIRWPQSADDIVGHYGWILECGSEYKSEHRTECPDHYKEHEDFWLATVQTTIHDTVDGNEAELSLAIAIDLLMPCHWNFVQNLEVVLGAIGGELKPSKPVTACARNIKLSPICSRMKIVSNTLRAFWKGSSLEEEIDREVLSRLGEATEVKRWLAASLDKTIRLQLQM